MEIGDFIVLEKIEDKRFNGFHPNMIDVGNTEIRGYYLNEIKEGEQLFLYPRKTTTLSYSGKTSPIVKYDKENQLLETANSVYKVHINKEVDWVF